MGPPRARRETIAIARGTDFPGRCGKIGGCVCIFCGGSFSCCVDIREEERWRVNHGDGVL